MYIIWLVFLDPQDIESLYYTIYIHTQLLPQLHISIRWVLKLNQVYIYRMHVCTHVVRRPVLNSRVSTIHCAAKSINAVSRANFGIVIGVHPSTLQIKKKKTDQDHSWALLRPENWAYFIKAT